MKRMLSVWLPAWAIERRRRLNPNFAPRDEPFALVVSGQRGIRITAVNEAAAREGITPGMALADARAGTPHLQSAPAELAKDRAALNALARWCGRYGPVRHRDGDDGFWIDVTGVAHLFGGEKELLENLSKALSRFGITAHVGLADTLGAAHALVRYGGDSTRVAVSKRASTDKSSEPFPSAAATMHISPPGETQNSLAGLPVAALRLAPETIVLLRRLGLTRIGQLYDVPRAVLARRFRSKKTTETVLLRLDQALGLQSEPRRPLSEPPALRVLKSWPDPLVSSEGIEAETGVLTGQLARRLEEHGLAAKHVRLVLYRADGTLAEVNVGFSRASRDGAHMLDLLREKFGTVDAGFGVDVLSLEAFQVARLEEKQSVLPSSSAKGQQAFVSNDPAKLIDRLVNRLGRTRVHQLAARESYMPERAQSIVPARAPSGDGTGANSKEHSESETPLPPSLVRTRLPPRPLFLLTPPELISVIAEIPEGAPMRFTWRRVAHRVVRSEGPERIAPEWWRHLPDRVAENKTETDAFANAALGEKVPARKLPRTRDYYRLEISSGAVYWVFRDGLYSAHYPRHEGLGEDQGHPQNSSHNASEQTALTPAEPPRWFVHGLYA